MAKRRSNWRRPVKCEAAEGGGASAPHLRGLRRLDIILARRQDADHAAGGPVRVSSLVFTARRLRIDSPRNSMR